MEDIRNDLLKDLQDANLKNLMVAHLAGSRSYGTQLPTSDWDVRGIFCADRVNVCTPFFPIREQNIPAMEDAKVYEVANFLKLYLDGNPNILESLWVDEEDILVHSEAYKLLRNYRSELLSKKVAFTFTGYALSQLKRIKGHNKWINNPQPTNPPSQADHVSLVQNFTKDKVLPSSFDLRDYNMDCRLVPFGNELFGLYVDHTLTQGYRTINEDGSINKIFDDESRFGYGPPDFLVKYNKEEWIRAKDNHTNYWNWKNNRNEARSLLEEEHGFDTKHGMHLVRLIRMGEEILTTGEVKVKRDDAEELLAIRDGAWSYEEIIKWAEGKDELIRGKLYNASDLPKKPNIKLAADVLMMVQGVYWR